MSEIKYMEKPDWVTWEDVLECLHEAHKVNQKKGFTMPGLNMSKDKYLSKLGDGHCFVALYQGRVVGTSSVRFLKIHKWWAWGKIVAYTGLDGILPEYRGTDVYFELQNIRKKCICDNGINVIIFNTSEHNKTVIKLNLRRGSKMVQYSATGKGFAYYSIVMAKWLNGCPYPDWFCRFMFGLSKIVVKMVWKPDRSLRWF